MEPGKPFDNLNMQQVSSFYTLLKVLRRLRVIGLLHVQTESMSSYAEFYDLDHGDELSRNYKLVYYGYDPSWKGRQSLEERLDQVFRIRYPQASS